MKKKLGIKVISEACGIVPHTIRTWESRYQVFKPERDARGQRLYDEQDLRKAQLIAQLLDRGHTISKLASRSTDDLVELLGVGSSHASANTNLRSSQLSTISIKKLFNYLGDYRIDKVASEMEHLRMSVGAREFIFEIILPVMQKIGTMVAKKTYTVTQEHIVSTIVRDQLGKICLPNLGSGNDRVVLATPDGNLHELSIIIADILCRANRITTSYLGASHPPEGLAEAVNALKSKKIVMGVVSSDGWNYKKNIIPYLLQIDSFLNHKVKVVLGGAYEIELPKFKHIEEVDFINDFKDFDQSLAEVL